MMSRLSTALALLLALLLSLAGAPAHPAVIVVKGPVVQAGTPTGGLLSLTIVDSTPLDINASSYGADGSGWVAMVKLKGLTSTVGTLDATKLTLTVTDPGYDPSTCTSTTVTRTITGVTHVRRQYPNGNSKMISTDGTDLTIYVTLDDWVYQGSTITAASIASGFYSSSAVSNAATRTNSSTVAYQKPLWGWLNIQQERAASSSVDVEAVAFHRHASAGQQVACVKFYATDGSNTSSTVTVTAPALSSKITQGNIPEAWKATVDLSALTSGMMVDVIGKAYPFLGDSGAVLDLSADAVAWPTSLPRATLRVYNDRSGTYGGGYAYVDGTGAGTPAVSSNAVTAKANPYASINAAVTAMAAWNNTNRSHNNYGGGTIRLMDDGAGGPKTHLITASITSNAGSTYLVIEKDPATAATITVSPGGAATFKQLTPLIKWHSLTIKADSAIADYMLIGYNGGTRDIFAADNCVFDNTANIGNWVLWHQLTYFTNVTFTGGHQFSLSDKNTALLAGSVGTTTSYPANDYTAKLEIGNIFANRVIKLDQTAGDGDHGRIIYNNRLNAIFLNNGSSNTLNYGLAVAQNLAEATPLISSSIHAFADGDLTQITNYLDFYNTAAGERASRLYNDVVADQVAPHGLPKIGTSKYNIWDNYNIKADYFNGGVGSVGNWAYEYGVGNVGNVSLFGMVNRTATEHPTNDATDNYLGNWWLSSSEYNLRRLLSEAAIMALFTSYTVQPQGSPALGGNYIPLNGSTALKSRVPSGKSILSYDIAGSARKTDGTGAAGAYEYAP